MSLILMVRDHVFERLPINEIEMMETLFNQFSLKAHQVIRIASPMKVGKNGGMVRANSLDTVVDFAKLNEKPKPVLVISS